MMSNQEVETTEQSFTSLDAAINSILEDDDGAKNVDIVGTAVALSAIAMDRVENMLIKLKTRGKRRAWKAAPLTIDKPYARSPGVNTAIERQSPVKTAIEGRSPRAIDAKPKPSSVRTAKSPIVQIQTGRSRFSCSPIATAKVNEEKSRTNLTYSDCIVRRKMKSKVSTAKSNTNLDSSTRSSGNPTALSPSIDKSSGLPTALSPSIDKSSGLPIALSSSEDKSSGFPTALSPNVDKSSGYPTAKSPTPSTSSLSASLSSTDLCPPVDASQVPTRCSSNNSLSTCSSGLVTQSSSRPQSPLVCRSRTNSSNLRSFPSNPSFPRVQPSQDIGVDKITFDSSDEEDVDANELPVEESVVRTKLADFFKTRQDYSKMKILNSGSMSPQDDENNIKKFINQNQRVNERPLKYCWVRFPKFFGFHAVIAIDDTTEGLLHSLIRHMEHIPVDHDKVMTFKNDPSLHSEDVHKMEYTLLSQINEQTSKDKAEKFLGFTLNCDSLPRVIYENTNRSMLCGGSHFLILAFKTEFVTIKGVPGEFAVIKTVYSARSIPRTKLAINVAVEDKMFTMIEAPASPKKPKSKQLSKLSCAGLDVSNREQSASNSSSKSDVSLKTAREMPNKAASNRQQKSKMQQPANSASKIWGGLKKAADQQDLKAMSSPTLPIGSPVGASASQAFVANRESVKTALSAKSPVTTAKTNTFQTVKTDASLKTARHQQKLQVQTPSLTYSDCFVIGKTKKERKAKQEIDSNVEPSAETKTEKQDKEKDDE